MTDLESKKLILGAIKNFKSDDVFKSALNLFSVLGYNITRQNPLESRSYKYFSEVFDIKSSSFKEEKALVSDWVAVDFLFQLTGAELTGQVGFFDTGRFDNKNIESYLFFAVELREHEYTRTELAQITREINKVFAMPVMVLFKYGLNITVSVINRRMHKRDERKDVLEKVTLIKDISFISPHRAHIEIFYDLSFSELKRIHKFTSFVGLDNAWQKTLDVKELNKKFYRDLSSWYFWALKEVEFPGTDIEKVGVLKNEEKVKEHNAKNLIRLLTRLLFVWFIKEKNLIPEELFDESFVKDNLLNGFEPRKKKGFDYKTQGSKYYRAILQNLFFATLNQTVGKREFRKEGQQVNVTNLMRYESYFKAPLAFTKLVEDIVPFMNGGLFECLDSPDPLLKGKRGGDIIIYEDGFSDRKDNMLCVPDYIFFGEAEQADLSEELDDKRKKDVKVSGLINILKSYKFTVAENTPIEEDIALDPELLGRVFENLLASYNPETKSTARKQTGSFYTPREIVNYMVDESLKAYLKQRLEEDAGMKPEDAEVGLEFLVGYNEKEHLFDERQTTALINAIDNCKILDPACGSGAFPMGVLHKLVHILHKLDPDNELWKEVQRQKAIKDTEDAFKIGNRKEREDRLKEISDVFELNSDDYGRKLYLIENCIYGVDIQPIATQISKLRFFISLIVDQKTDKNKDNFGVRPLPNLETKFVAANTLIGIENPKLQTSLFENPKVQELETKLKDVRHRLFSAKSPATKRKLREEDQRIRVEMGAILEDAGWSNESARQLALWDPYDQNASSDWFSPGWMFGVESGFDVVIGNPPYVFTRDVDFKGDFKKYIENEYFSKMVRGKKSKSNQSGKINLFAVFIIKGLLISKQNGYLSYIVPNNILRTTTYDIIRRYILENSFVDQIVDLGSGIFANVTASTVVIGISNKQNCFNTKVITDIQNIEKHDYKIKEFDQRQFMKNVSFSFNIYMDRLLTIVSNKISEGKNILKNYCIDNIEGIVAHKHLILECPNKSTFPLVEGKDIKRFYINEPSNYLIWRPNEIHRTRPDYLWSANKKIITQRISGGAKPLVCAVDTNKYKCFASTNNILLKTDYETHYYFISAILNSNVINWYYANNFSNNSELTVNISKTYMEQLPIANFSNTIHFLSLMLHSGIFDSIYYPYFLNVINACIYELYFPEEIKSADAEVLKHLSNLTELEDNWSDEEKLEIIKKIYLKFSNPNHPVSIAIERQKTVKEVRIIEGLD